MSDSSPPSPSQPSGDVPYDIQPAPADQLKGNGNDTHVGPGVATQRRTGSHGGKKNRARRVIFRELVTIAAEQGAPITLGMSTADALQQCLDRAVALWRFAAAQVDALTMLQSDMPDPDAAEEFWEVETGPNGATTVVPNRWYRMETDARAEVERLAGMMTQLGIAERTVKIEEAKAVLMVAAIRDAALAAGIPPDSVRELGIQLRARLEDARGHVETDRASAQRQVASMGPGH